MRWKVGLWDGLQCDRLTGHGLCPLLPLGLQLSEWRCRELLLTRMRPGEQGAQKQSCTTMGLTLSWSSTADLFLHIYFLHIYFLHLAVPRPAV